MFHKRNPWWVSTQSYFAERNSFQRRKHVRFSKMFKPKERLIRFPSFSLLGGNRRDPLNLNELIRQRNQLTINDENTRMNVHGDDQPIEILLPPDIYDPLCLDISLQNNENSISVTSDNQHSSIQTTQTNFQTRKPNWLIDQQVPETKITQFKKQYRLFSCNKFAFAN
ncbi:unnamed protein product [Rotaria socialis]|uniref:Uncharacterized protein n=2 Tax=Rotaria socialis TaxID=392032 RepID=A0A818K6Z8_9BILA|nr:unnamed protein product [Rotaria socialis]